MAGRDASAWIGLGGNQDDPATLIGAALACLDAEPEITVVRHSRLFHSPPWGLREQADFINAVAELRTRLTPSLLLQALLAVERDLGREREGPRWGPRRIDLDLLTYEDVQSHTAELTLPHPRMQQRAFVLVPLLELDPGFVIPGIGPASRCLQDIDPEEVASVLPVSQTGQETTP